MKHNLLLILINLIIFIHFVMSQLSVTEDKYDPVTNMIEQSGYPAESHFVRTKDNYILKMHRIPYGITLKILNPPAGVTTISRIGDGIKSIITNKARPIVFLMHGIFGSSADFVIPGPEKALAYILADAGYDVWMGNARGNTYSRKHVYLEPESSAFWNFSWHEIGVLDLPAMINYALEKENQTSIHYIGYSQGVTSVMVLLSTKRSYSIKFKTVMAMAPAVYFARSQNRVLKRLSQYSSQYEFFVNKMEMYETFPSTDLTKQVGTLCNDDYFIQGICEDTLFAMVGADSGQLNKAMLSQIAEYFPAGSSWKQLVHYAQLVESKRFQKYDFNSQSTNINMYGIPNPPEYRISRIKVPIALFYGSNDNFISVLDVEDLANDLTNVISKNEIIGWNHMDMLFANEANTVIYKKIIELIRHTEDIIDGSVPDDRNLEP